MAFSWRKLKKRNRTVQADPAPSPPSEPAPMAGTWEDFICLNSGPEPEFEVLGRAADYVDIDSRANTFASLDYHDALAQDTGPLPTPEDREGYYGSDHFSYWASGYRDAKTLVELQDLLGRPVKSYLDLGCASGRVVRHMMYQWPEIETYGCDINRFHVEWCNRYLPSNGTFFHSHSIPNLPLVDNSLDVVSAFSVFTHIEAMETAWLLELRRVLKPGGLAWVTVHSEHTLQDMDEAWPLWAPTMSHPDAATRLDSNRDFQGDRMVLRWKNDRSYASNVFYKMDYMRRTWGRIFEIADVRRRCPEFQDVFILRKPG